VAVSADAKLNDVVCSLSFRFHTNFFIISIIHMTSFRTMPSESVQLRRTVAIATLSLNDIRSMGKDEILRVRELAAA
jgi:hypothetical protein